MSDSLTLLKSDTIAAVATARGVGAIGVIRVSGKNLLDFVHRLTGRTPEPRHAHAFDFLDETGTAIDRGLLLYFPAPHSFTGEDVVEIQAHGGPVVLDMLLSRALALGARPAEPGEFSLRAFLNGKIDLVQAESIADLIAATTRAAALSAGRSLSGAFSARIDDLSAALVALRTHVEAMIDFSDEDIDALDDATVRKTLDALIERTETLLGTATQGVMLRDGFRIALIGRPNVGKSSLMNRLLGEDRAIVTDHAGTTRDSLSETLSLNGVPATLVDTAGLHDTDHPIERLGVVRTWRETTRADLILRLIDASVGETGLDRALCEKLPKNVPTLVVANKIDLIESPPPIDSADAQAVISCSAKTGDGLEALTTAMLAAIGWQVDPSEPPFIARARHLAALRSVDNALRRARSQLDALDCAAEELRLAHRALGEIVGAFDAEDLLGEIFSSFCIGK